MTVHTVLDIVRAVDPQADEEFAHIILWGHTPYPAGKICAKTIYRAASRVVRAENNKISLCVFCPNKAMEGKWECSRCRNTLNSCVTAEEVEDAKFKILHLGVDITL